MKKYLFILVSSSFLVAFDGANAAENRQVTEAARTMNTKPHWADFMADPAYDAVKSNMGFTHPAAIKEALEKAYDAWLPGHLAANPVAAGAGFRAAVATGKSPAQLAGAGAKVAAAAVGDTLTLRALGRSHKRALIKSMVEDNAAATSTAVVAHVDAAGNHPLREALAEHHKAPLIAAMAAHNAADTATAVVENAGLRGEVTNKIAANAVHRGAMITEMATRDAAGTATEVVGNAGLKQALATTHRGAMITEMATGANAPGTATSIIQHPILETEIGKAIHSVPVAGQDAHVARLLGTDQAGAADASSADRAETRAAVIREMLRKDDFRNAVITALQNGHHAVSVTRADGNPKMVWDDGRDGTHADGRNTFWGRVAADDHTVIQSTVA